MGRQAGGHPDAPPRERAGHHPPAFQAGADVVGSVPGGQEHEVGLGVGDRPSPLPQRGGHPLPLGHQGRHPAPDLVPGLQRGQGRGLGRAVDVERDQAAVHRGDDLRVGDGVADPHPGQRVGLGEGPGDDDVGVVVEQAVERVAQGRVCELPVGLVHQHHHVVGHPGQQLGDLIGGRGRAGGVVGVGQGDHPGPLAHRAGHRVEVVGAIDQRDLHQGGAHRLGYHREGLEGDPRGEHLVAGIEVGHGELVDDGDRPGPHRHPVGADAHPVGDGRPQGDGPVVAVQVGRLHLPGHGFGHGRQRRVGVLVAGQLDRVGDAVIPVGLAGRPPRPVADQRPNGRPGRGPPRRSV